MCECTSALCNCKCPSFLVRVTVFSHSDKIFEWDVTMLQPFGKKLVSCAHGNMHSFSVFSREAVWPSSSGNLQLSFLRDLMHCKLQISFSYQGTTFFFFSFPLAVFCHFLAVLRNPELCIFCNYALWSFWWRFLHHFLATSIWRNVTSTSWLPEDSYPGKHNVLNNKGLLCLPEASLFWCLHRNMLRGKWKGYQP